MSTRIIRDKEAEETLREENFRSQWTRLYEACPWATGYQRPGFILRWWEAYRDRYRLVLACEFSAANELVGFLPVVIDNVSDQATLPGAHQAEYKVWLALPANGSTFLAKALPLLARETGIRSLSFRSAWAPLEWDAIAREVRGICELKQVSRPIIRIDDAARVTEYLRKKNSLKSTKSKWNRLRRLGKIEFAHIANPAELTPILDQLITHYEIRQEAVHAKRTFQTDAAKKPFHLALLGEPGLLHVTVMSVGHEIVSASFGVTHRGTYSLAMSMFSPAYAYYSPVMLHFLMLVEQLHHQRFSVLDLTVGTDPFKERFAAEWDQVQILSVYLRRREWITNKIRQKSEAATRPILRALRVAPHAAHDRLIQLRRLPAREWPSFFGQALRLLVRKAAKKKEVRLYALESKARPSIDSAAPVIRDRLDDLLAFQPSDFWRTRQRFLAESLQRIEDGQHFYTCMENGRLAHLSWVVESSGTSSVPEIRHESFPPGSILLCDGYTDPAYRGRGLCQSVLRRVVQDAQQNEESPCVFALVTVDNAAARHILEKFGFADRGGFAHPRGPSATDADVISREASRGGARATDSGTPGVDLPSRSSPSRSS